MNIAVISLVIIILFSCSDSKRSKLSYITSKNRFSLQNKRQIPIQNGIKRQTIESGNPGIDTSIVQSNGLPFDRFPATAESPTLGLPSLGVPTADQRTQNNNGAGIGYNENPPNDIQSKGEHTGK